MRIVMFYHSLVSDWNHGNAHFLRGVTAELIARGHQVTVFEPVDSWSRQNLVQEHGESAVEGFYQAYPGLTSRQYRSGTLDLDRELEDADLVLVHEWNDHELVAAIGQHRAATGAYRLLFHDTHHRSVTQRDGMSEYQLESYDGVLAFGEVIRERYLAEGWANQVFTWHEAADTRRFFPRTNRRLEGDLIWVGNWGDEERTAELEEFLIRPAQALGLRARVHVVRYPEEGRTRLAEAGIDYAGWLPNYQVPEVFARYRMTLHIPRRPYVEALPGIPTIRVFEALACGLPLISSPWEDAEHLFTPGEDFLVARNGREMREHMRSLLADPESAQAMACRGHKTIVARHTCRHRVDELLGIVDQINGHRPLSSDHELAGAPTVETT